ncbi:MAG TPA: alpha/beta hydrolase [Thermomicrobiales bacterium]|nr:alpha/beta hydrolase [Thermomicrobiales bacterium]
MASSPLSLTVSRRRILSLAAGGGAMAVAAPTRLSGFARPGTSPQTLPTDDEFAGLFDIGGRSIYLESLGTGGPTVILESGAGNDARVWDTVSLPARSTNGAVLPEVATFTRVCAYDRPGTFLGPGIPGRSDSVPMPRTAGEIVSDLHALLAAADIAGPYVMVGHSFGGLVVRLYASTYPNDVVGLVLVDAAHEAYYTEIQQVLTPAQWDSFVRPGADPDYPNLERIDIDASATEMRETAIASPLRCMPLVVLTHGQPWEWPANFPVGALEDLWPPLQDRLASLVPDARLVVAEESGHFIQLQQPDLVIEAIRQVVDAIRDTGTWAASATTPSMGHNHPSHTSGMAE